MNGITEIQEYMLVVLSSQPLDVTALVQSDLELGNKRLERSGFGIEEEKENFVLPDGDWLVRKVPIRIVYLSDGEVAFLIGDTFSDPFAFSKFSSGMASVTIQVRKSFTVAALIYDGTCLLKN